MLFFPDRRFRNERLQARFHLRRPFEDVLKFTPGLFVHHKKSLIQKGLFRLFASTEQNKFGNAHARHLSCTLDKGGLERRRAQP